MRRRLIWRRCASAACAQQKIGYVDLQRALNESEAGRKAKEEFKVQVDKAQSQVADKVAFSVPPSPLPGGGYAHGFAIASKANATDEEKACAGLFVAWATSKEQEARRLAAGQPGELTRTSTYQSPEYATTFGQNLADAMAATGEKTTVTF